MSPQVLRFARFGLWLLPLWAVMLFLGTMTHQPDPQTAFGDWSAYVTTTRFLASHLVNSIVGAAIGSIAVVSLTLYLADSHKFPIAFLGMAATVAANTLNTAVFGVAAFVQPVLGRAFLNGQTNAPDLYNAIYAAPVFATAIPGLILMLVGGVLVGLAIARSGRFPRWAGWLYAISMILFAVSVFFFSNLQSVILALFFVSTLTVAWVASRHESPQTATAGAVS